MRRIAARTLLQFSESELWETLTGKFILVFDDGEFETTARKTLYSMYSWTFHRFYPLTPILKKHHVQFFMKKGRLKSNTHARLIGEGMWSVYDTYVARADLIQNNKDEEVLRDKLAELSYDISNRMYNELTYKLEDYVTSLDILDFIEVFDQERVTDANLNVVATEESINNTYSVISDVLTKGEGLQRNPISLAVQSSLVKTEQVLQCVGPRGYLTDTNSDIFPQPILKGFLEGIRSMHDSLLESRSAAKSLIFSKDPLQQAEYFSRRLQLVSQIVRNLHRGNCGATEYLPWKLNVFDLEYVEGMYYMDEDNVLKRISLESQELLGRTLRLRTPIHCAHPDPYGICTTCFGDLSLNVPPNTNIGHMCSASIGGASSQNILSVKHSDGSSSVDPLVLTEVSFKYLKAHADKTSYLLSDKIRHKAVTLVIPASGASSITDINHVKEITELNITRVSELTRIGIMVNSTDVSDIVPLPVSAGRRLASMTYPLLRHIKKMGFGVDALGNYTIDMTGWNWAEPILTLPLKHFNMSDHSKDISDMLESRIKNMEERDNSATPNAVLTELYDLVNSKLSIHLSTLAVVVYGSMIVSAEDDDYSLPKPWTDRGMGVMAMTMARRSASVGMAFEGHVAKILDPKSFTQPNLPDHLFDALLMPYEVLEQPHLHP